MTKQVEFRVRPVTKYVVTRFEQGEEVGVGCPGGSETRGTYENGEVAYQVAYALCKAEHDASGEPLGSMNFIYPKIPDGVSVAPDAI